MASLREELVKLGKEHPELRPHIRPILASRQAAYRPPMTATYSGRIAAILASICNGEIRSADDMLRALSALKETTQSMLNQTTGMFMSDPEIQAQQVGEFCDQFKQDLQRRLKPSL